MVLFWKNIDPVRRAKFVKISGLILLVFALFSLIATLSYPFTWKADQSLMGDPESMDPSFEVSNLAGKNGARWGYLLMCRLFGLGSYALDLVLFILSVRMLFGRQPFSVAKAVLLSIAAAIVGSFIAAYVSSTLGMDNALGGGLGGECGKYVVAWSVNLFGKVLTLFLLVVLLALWFLFASKRFSDWFLALGTPKEKKPVEEKAPAEEKPKKGKGFTWGEKIKETATALKSDIHDEIGKAKEELASVGTEPSETAEPEKPEAPVMVHAPAPQTASANAAAPDQTATPVQVAAASTDVSAKVAADPAAPGAVPDGKLEVVNGEELSTEVTEELPRIDVREELKDYRFPPLSLLGDYEEQRHEVSQEELKRNNYKIRATLKTYRIDVDTVKAVVGPTVTLYKVYPAPGVKISAIRNRQDDIAMALHSKGLRIVTLEDSVGIEVANDHPSIVPLKAMLNDDSFRNSKAELPVAIGYTITQKVKVFDLADAPHLLVAGATKQGKSVGLNVLINSLLFTKHPSELKFVFIDPKMVEFSSYAMLLHHYLAVLPDSADADDEMAQAICKTPDAAERTLRSLCMEMDDRYSLMSKAYVNKVTLYNEKYKDRHLRPDQGHRYMPYIVVVVDEFADLTMSVGTSGEQKAKARSISTSIIRLAQKGRAAGIHLVIATQRPSVDVVTGLIKSNFPTRIAFRVFSAVDSKTILDAPGADKLIGRGDMIYYAGVDMERVQCAFISNDEIREIAEFIGNQTGYKKSYNTPYYLPEPDPENGEDGAAMVDMQKLDERFEEAAKQVVMTQRGSTSDLQRKLGMGYAKAGRVMDQLEAAGIVGPQQGSKPREVLVQDLGELEQIISAYRKAAGGEDE